MSKSSIDIDKACEMILEGNSLSKISKELKVNRSVLVAFLAKEEYSARVREARLNAADTFAEKAEQVLIDAAKDGIEIQRARELAQHYRWKASKLAPKKYGDKLDLNHGGNMAITTTDIEIDNLSPELKKQVLEQLRAKKGVRNV